MIRRVLPLALALAVGFGSTACESNNPTAPESPIDDPPGAATASDLQFCLDETNRYRALGNRSAVSHSPSLSDRARTAAEQDHATKQAHSYFNSHPFNGAENEALWWSGSNVRQTIGQAIAFFYNEGPSGPHYQNLMGSYSEVGCGVATGGGGITFVQDLR